jgi:hypothetical protein
VGEYNRSAQGLRDGHYVLGLSLEGVLPDVTTLASAAPINRAGSEFAAQLLGNRLPREVASGQAVDEDDGIALS